MNEDSNARLSRTSEKRSIQSVTAASTSQGVEHGETSTRSTEDDINLQCTSANIYKDLSNDDREPMFVIMDSNCTSNPSSKETLVNKRNIIKETYVKMKPKHNVIPTDIPCSSRDHTDFILLRDQERESREELQMVDINLQSENEIIIDEDDTEPESIVIAYLRNKEGVLDNDGLPTTRKKSSILENVPKMETIPENKQFASFSGHLRCDSLESHQSMDIENKDNSTGTTSAGSTSLIKLVRSLKEYINAELSEHSLDVHIPSYPGSSRSLHVGSSHSLESLEEQDADLREAIAFLHQDKELLIAAEIGNDSLLEKYIRRGTDIQQVDHLGRNALHLAVSSGNLRAVKLLLDAGVNPNIKDNVGMTPLSLSLMRRPSLTVANLLFDYGARLLTPSKPMDTGLFIQFVMMCTPTSEEENILRLLVYKGAILNDPRAPGGRQPLHFAAMSNNTVLIRLLVSLGADLDMTNHRNETPKEVAATFKCKEAYELLNELEQSDNNDTSVE